MHPGFPRKLPSAAMLALLVPGLAVFAQTESTPPPVTIASESQNGEMLPPQPHIQASPVDIGDAYMARRRYQAAIEAYRHVHKPDSETWNKMGVAYQLMFNTEEAEECYKKALRLNSKNAIAWNNLGSLEMEMQDYGGAERAFKKALSHDPNSALFHKNLGTAYLSLRKFKLGWQAYESALKIDPDVFAHQTGVRIENPASLHDRGAMNFYMAKGCTRAGMVKEAVDYLRMAFSEGFTTPKKILADPEFSSLRAYPPFQQLMASQGVNIGPLAANPPVHQ